MDRCSLHASTVNLRAKSLQRVGSAFLRTRRIHTRNKSVTQIFHASAYPPKLLKLCRHSRSLHQKPTVRRRGPLCASSDEKHSEESTAVEKVDVESIDEQTKHVVENTLDGSDEDGEFSWRWRARWAWDILVYGVPAISIPIADPLMTAVDTIFVGQSCTVSELASMGPTGNIISVMSYAFGFLSVATIKRMSQARARGEEEEQEIGALMQQAFLLALVVGITLVTATQVFAGPLLRLAGANADTFGAALSYLRVRILAQPAVILCAVSQSGLLAMKDSTTPLTAVTAMCIVNCIGDTLMVGFWNYGVTGIAWATVIAQYCAVAVLFRSWSRRPKEECPFANRPLPSIKDLKSFSADFGVLWGISSLRTLCYSCVRLAAATLGTLPCAAHTALYAVWMPLCFTPFPLRQAAIVFLPPFFHKDENEHSADLKPVSQWASLTHEGQEVLKVLLVLGVAFGITAAMAVLIPAWVAPSMLTRDATLLPLIRSLALPAFAALAVSGVMEIAEGVLLIGTKEDNKFLLRSMMITIFLLNVVLQVSHHFNFGLSGVWWALVGFYFVRVAQPLSHILRATMVPVVAPAT